METIHYRIAAASLNKHKFCQTSNSGYELGNKNPNMFTKNLLIFQKIMHGHHPPHDDGQSSLFMRHKRGVTTKSRWGHIKQMDKQYMRWLENLVQVSHTGGSRGFSDGFWKHPSPTAEKFLKYTVLRQNLDFGNTVFLFWKKNTLWSCKPPQYGSTKVYRTNSRDTDLYTAINLHQVHQ